MALYALLEMLELFQSYVAIDPSLWWDNQVIAHRAARELESNRERQALIRSAFILLPSRCSTMTPKGILFTAGARNSRR